MKIALLGYGKMGREIERTALGRGHSIVLRVDKDTDNFALDQADIAIDFSIPSAAVNNITHCLKNNIPIVSGTTGWLHNYDKVVNLCKKNNGAFIYASNFSLGVNIFFELNRVLAKMMRKLDQYKVCIEEIHHTLKLDAPSGTAISLAEGIIENSDLNGWKLVNDNPSVNEIPITAKRIENIPGTHTVSYESEIDRIDITHTAHNRKGFALGAVIAAEWLVGKKGVFTMNDVLNLS